MNGWEVRRGELGEGDAPPFGSVWVGKRSLPQMLHAATAVTMPAKPSGGRWGG